MSTALATVPVRTIVRGIADAAARWADADFPPRVRVLEPNRQTTRAFGEIATQLRQAGIAIQQNDIWIAALCKQHGFALATRHHGFQHVLGLEVIESEVHVPETRGSR